MNKDTTDLRAITQREDAGNGCSAGIADYGYREVVDGSTKRLLASTVSTVHTQPPAYTNHFRFRQGCARRCGVTDRCGRRKAEMAVDPKHHAPAERLHRSGWDAAVQRADLETFEEPAALRFDDSEIY